MEIALGALGLALAWRAFGGYPPLPSPCPARLARREAACVAAAADALFPRGGAVPPSGLDAGVVAWVDRWLDALPAATRRLVRAPFPPVEHAPPAFPARRSGGPAASARPPPP